MDSKSQRKRKSSQQNREQCTREKQSDQQPSGPVIVASSATQLVTIAESSNRPTHNQLLQFARNHNGCYNVALIKDAKLVFGSCS